MTDTPRPWACATCGGRLLWTRTTIECRLCGVLSTHHVWNADKNTEEGFFGLAPLQDTPPCPNFLSDSAQGGSPGGTPPTRNRNRS